MIKFFNPRAALIALGFVLLFISCNEELVLERFNNDTDNYSINYPESWTVKKGEDINSATLYEPINRESEEQDSISIEIQNIPSIADLDVLVKAYYLRLNNSGTLLTIKSDDSLQINGNAFRKLNYQLTVYDRRMQYLVYFTINKGRFFTIACSSLQNAFDDKYALFEKICESIEFDN